MNIQPHWLVITPTEAGPEAFLGISIAAVGMLVALLAASGIRDGKPREPDHDEPWWARELRDDPPKPKEPDHDG